MKRSGDSQGLRARVSRFGSRRRCRLCDYGVTVNWVMPLAVVVPVTVAVIVTGPPAFRSAALPFVPVVKASTVRSDDVQVAEPVRSTEPLLHVPVAINCWDPVARVADEFEGLIWSVGCRPAHATVTVVELVSVPEAAWTVPLPGITPVTRPPGVMVTAPAGETDVNDQLALTVDVLPSLKVPLATICTVHTEPAGHVGGGPGVSAVIVGVGPRVLDAVRAVSEGFTQNPAQPANSSNATVAKMTNNTPARP
jgi:hypothetical protein